MKIRYFSIFRIHKYSIRGEGGGGFGEGERGGELREAAFLGIYFLITVFLNL